MHIKEMFDLTGKVAIVTGGGSGIGKQIALGFAEAGANVVICSRKVESCQDVAKEMKQMGVQSLAIKCDVTNKNDIDSLVEQVIERFGKIDILVNNSGTSWGASVLDTPLDAWNKVANTNVTGTFLMSQAVGREMIRQQSGKIINIASIAALGGSDPELMDSIAYNASKGAVITFTKDLAVKWGKYNINVNAISPGIFPTKISKVMINRAEERFIQSTPLNRLGSETDLKGAAVFLASNASNFVSGDVLVVDGGLTSNRIH